MTMTISEILRGCMPEKIQSVGFMQVIPLTSELHFDQVANPSKAYVGTSNYGSLSFTNDESDPLIVPAHAAYLVKQAAQNHAMTHAGIVKKRKSQQFDTAACIQQSQGGTISKGQHEMVILPAPLREKAFTHRGTNDYAKLWPAISDFNKRAGTKRQRGGHLEDFFDSFVEQLDQFVAEFEPVENQVGAIVLIGGKIAGIERTPNPEYFLDIWKPLIRECYGSMAVLEAKEHNGNPPVPKTRVSLREVDSLDDLEHALSQAEEQEYDKVKSVVNGLLSIDLNNKQEGKDGNFTLSTVGGEEGSRFIGQTVKHDEQVVYASLIAREAFHRNEEWFTANPFKM